MNHNQTKKNLTPPPDTAEADGIYDGDDMVILHTPIDFDEDGFFIYDDDREVCF